MVEILISWDHVFAIMTADVAFRSWNFLPSPEQGLLSPTHISVLGQHAEHDVLAAVCAELCLPATVVLMDLQLVEAHGQLTELALDRALWAFLGLVNLQQVPRQALLTHRAPHLLVPTLAVLFHLCLKDWPLALLAEDQEQLAVGLMEGQMARGHTSFATGPREKKNRFIPWN